jgi:hypothetical protein
MSLTKGEIKFCQKEIRLAKEDEDWDIMDKEHILDRVVATYHELIRNTSCYYQD